MDQDLKDKIEMLDAKIMALASVIKFLKPGDAAFARDLRNSYSRGGFLSEKQWAWVDRLTARATDTEEKPVQLKENVGGFEGVIKLFQKAKQHLKYPKIVLMVGQQKIALSVAGEHSKAPGTVQVTDGRPYTDNTWFGRVTPEGEWYKNGHLPSADLEAVGSFLKKFGQDPAGTAKIYGHMSGLCCFCNSKLTDERSTAAGFGPVCAKNFGLEEEWKAAAKAATTQA